MFAIMTTGIATVTFVEIAIVSIAANITQTPFDHMLQHNYLMACMTARLAPTATK